MTTTETTVTETTATPTAATPTVPVTNAYATQAEELAKLGLKATSLTAENDAPISYGAILRACMGNTADAEVQEALHSLHAHCTTQWKSAFTNTRKAVATASSTHTRQDQDYASRACYISMRLKKMITLAEELQAERGTLTENHRILREFIDHQVLSVPYFGRYSLMDKVQLVQGRVGSEATNSKRVQGGQSLTFFMERHLFLSTTEEGYILTSADEHYTLSAAQAYYLLTQKKHLQTAPATYQGVMRFDFTGFIPKKDFTLNGYTAVIEAGSTPVDINGDLITLDQPVRVFFEFSLLEGLNPSNELIKQYLGKEAMFARHAGDREYLEIMKWYGNPMLTEEKRAKHFLTNGRLFGYDPKELASLETFLPARERVQAAFALQQAASAKARAAAATTNFRAPRTLPVTGDPAAPKSPFMSDEDDDDLPE